MNYDGSGGVMDGSLLRMHLKYSINVFRILNRLQTFLYKYVCWWIMMVVVGDVWSIASMDEQRDLPAFALFYIYISYFYFISYVSYFFFLSIYLIFV